MICWLGETMRMHLVEHLSVTRSDEIGRKRLEQFKEAFERTHHEG